MTMIRMETENVRDAAVKIDYAVQELSLKPRRMRSAANSLKSAWSGRQASKLAGELKNKAALLDAEVDNLQMLAQRMRNEVSEWEYADNNKMGVDSLAGIIQTGNPLPLFLGGVIIFGPKPIFSHLPVQPKLSEPNNLPDWEIEIGKEQFVTEWTKNKGMQDGKPSLGVQANIDLFDGAYAEGEGSANWDVGGADIGGTVGEYGVSQWEVGAKFGAGEDGFTAGAYAEYDVAEVSGAMVLGSSMLGITLGGEASAGSADAFVGYKEGTVGASIGASAAAGEVGLGLNVAGINVGVGAGLSAGVEFGITIGAETEVKVGPFMVGLHFGKAISD
jgi:hypothetical protein